MTAAYLVLTVYARFRALPSGEQYTAFLSRGGRTLRLAAIRDSGNRLTEPFSGEPAAVADLRTVQELLTAEEIAAALRPDQVGSGGMQQLRLIPCRTACGVGAMIAFHPDRLVLEGEEGCLTVEEDLDRSIGGPGGQRRFFPAAASGVQRTANQGGNRVFTGITELKNRIWSWILRHWPGVCYYIGGAQVLPPPLERDEEREVFARLAEGDESARRTLIERNLRLVVYIARKFETTGIGIEDLISIGTIGLIKAVNTFCPEKNIKLATYASRCIENEILMYLRKSQNQRSEISIDEPLKVDWDGNEMMLSDILGTEPDIISRPIEQSAEQAMLLSAVDRLSDRERQIMHLRFGLRGGTEHTQKEVADAIGISQSYISRLEKRILSRLRRELHDL